MTYKNLASLLILLSLFLFINCDNINSISVAPLNVNFQKVGQSITLDFKALDRKEIEISDAKFNFISRDTNIAGVDDKGVITAHGDGETTIEVTSGKISEYVHVKVILPQKLIVEPQSLTLNLAAVQKLKAKLVDRNGNEINGINYQFVASDPTAIKVEPDGTLLAVKEGEYDVTVTAGDKSVKVHIVVPIFDTSEGAPKKTGSGRSRDAIELEQQQQREDPRLKLFDNLP